MIWKTTTKILQVSRKSFCFHNTIGSPVKVGRFVVMMLFNSASILTFWTKRDPMIASFILVWQGKDSESFWYVQIILLLCGPSVLLLAFFQVSGSLVTREHFGVSVRVTGSRVTGSKWIMANNHSEYIWILIINIYINY